MAHNYRQYIFKIVIIIGAKPHTRGNSVLIGMYVLIHAHDAVALIPLVLMRLAYWPVKYLYIGWHS